MNLGVFGINPDYALQVFSQYHWSCLYNMSHLRRAGYIRDMCGVVSF